MLLDEPVGWDRLRRILLKLARIAIAAAGILLVCAAGALIYLDHEFDPDTRRARLPELREAPQPDDAGLEKISRLPKAPFWSGKRDPLDHYELALKHNAEDGLLWLRGFRQPGFGEGKPRLLDDASTEWTPSPIYRYEIRTGRIGIAEESEWRALPQATNCFLAPTLQHAGRGATGRDLIGSNPPSEAFAWNVVDVRESPSGELASVVSASGKHRWEGSDWGSRWHVGAGADGRHYHETVRWPEGGRVGGPVKIDFGTIEGLGAEACWTPDERYVVFYQPDGEWVSVIATGKR